HGEEHAVFVHMACSGDDRIADLLGKELEVHDRTCSRIRSYSAPMTSTQAWSTTHRSPAASGLSTPWTSACIAVTIASTSPGRATTPALFSLMISAASPATTPQIGTRRAISE